MCHLLFGMIHALSRPIHSQRHHLFCIIPQAPPVFHLVHRRISQNGRRTESAQHSRAWSTHQKAADCLFQQSAVFWRCHPTCVPNIIQLSLCARCSWPLLEHPIQARSVYAHWFSCYTSCRCAIQDADDFTGSFSPAASWLYSCRRSCTSCTLNSDPVFRRLPDGLFSMPYLGLAVHTIVSNLCPFLFVVLQFGSAAMSSRHIQTVIHVPVIYVLYFSFISPAIFPNKTRFSQVL